MSKPLKPRRGTTAQNNATAGVAYEITYDTDKNTIVCRDGKTAGGYPLQRADLQAIKDAAQDTAIAGKLDTTGGTMTGELKVRNRISIEDGDLRIKKSSYVRGSIPESDVYQRIMFADNVISALALFDHTVLPNTGMGRVRIISYAYDGSSTTFQVSSDPSTGRKYAAVEGKEVLTSDGGKVFLSPVTDDMTILFGGPDGVSTPRIIIRGKNRSYQPGGIDIRAENPNAASMIQIQADGSFTHDSKPVLSLEASWYDSAKWGMKFSNGFIIQGGKLDSATAKQDVVFDMPFTSQVFPLGALSVSSDVTYAGNVAYSTLTLTGVTIYRNNTETCWAFAGW